MQNSELFRKNLELYNELQKLNYDYEQVNRELEVCKQKIAELTAQLHEKLESTVIPQNNEISLKQDFSYKRENVKLSNEVEYGAEVIGKIVVEAAKKANDLTSNTSAENKELVNLILGRTEVEKANILNIVSSQCSIDEKYSKMDECFKNATEYFEDIMAQKG